MVYVNNPLQESGVCISPEHRKKRRPQWFVRYPIKQRPSRKTPKQFLDHLSRSLPTPYHNYPKKQGYCARTFVKVQCQMTIYVGHNRRGLVFNTNQLPLFYQPHHPIRIYTPRQQHKKLFRNSLSLKKLERRRLCPVL